MKEYNGIQYEDSTKGLSDFLKSNLTKEKIIYGAKYSGCDPDGDLINYNGFSFYIHIYSDLVIYKGNDIPTLGNYINNLDETILKRIKFLPLKTNYRLLISYNDWEIFIWNNKFYVADKHNNFIKEVILTKLEKSKSNDDPVDFPNCDYCGQSDDLNYDLGFNLL